MNFQITNNLDEIVAKQLLLRHEAGLSDLEDTPKAYNWTVGIISDLKRDIAAYQSK